jgi:hypothetical protein
MPRRKTHIITVEKWPDLKVGRLYVGTVKSVSLDKASNCLHVTIEGRDGRRHEIRFRLPVRPQSRASAFFMACGINATEVGRQIRIDEVVGRDIGLRYRGQADGESEQFDFEPITPAPTAETTVPAANSIGTERPTSKNPSVPLADHEIPF